jgi:histone demethylase JARID1
MRDALPHLFARDRLLLHKLITMLSPSQLVARGVPVCRAVQIPGSFIVTFPDAYHAGFNSGFNVAEAVNFAAPDWLPFGSSSVVRYRCGWLWFWK